MVFERDEGLFWAVASILSSNSSFAAMFLSSVVLVFSFCCCW